MKGLWLIALVGVLVLYILLVNSHPIRLNQASSYAQTTNHATPPPVNLGPIQGHPTAYQVNQWVAYEV